MEGFFLGRRAIEKVIFDSSIATCFQSEGEQNHFPNLSRTSPYPFNPRAVDMTATGESPQNIEDAQPGLPIISSVERLKDFEEAQMSLNSLRFEDLAPSPPAPAPAPPIATGTTNEQPAEPTLSEDPPPLPPYAGGPLPSYLSPASPTPNPATRRFRSQYRRQLVAIREQEQITIARMQQQRVKYVEEQEKFRRRIRHEDLLREENLRRMGVGEIPRGLVPMGRQRRPRVELNVDG